MDPRFDRFDGVINVILWRCTLRKSGQTSTYSLPLDTSAIYQIFVYLLEFWLIILVFSQAIQSGCVSVIVQGWTRRIRFHIHHTRPRDFQLWMYGLLWLPFRWLGWGRIKNRSTGIWSELQCATINYQEGRLSKIYHRDGLLSLHRESVEGHFPPSPVHSIKRERPILKFPYLSITYTCPWRQKITCLANTSYHNAQII